MENGTVTLISDKTLLITAPDGHETYITFDLTSSTVEVYIKLVRASIDFKEKVTP